MADRPLAENIDMPPIEVRHADLKQWGKSAFVRVCPACNDGLLPVRRESPSFVLMPDDRCLLCGQAFVYTDIEDLRKNDWASHV